jgi:thiamine kinase-like enzyme
MDVGSFLQFFGMSFPGYLQFLGERLFDDERKMYEAILSALPRLWEKRLKPRLEARSNLTLIHMDFHFANVLLPRTPGSDDVRLIDWASWNIYMGAQDLAYAIGLHWSPKRRKVLEADMVKLYHQRLLAHGVEGYSWEECWDDYRIGIIVNVLSPILRWAMFDEAKTGWWWSIVERTLQAFEDLDCAELLA